MTSYEKAEATRKLLPAGARARRSYSRTRRVTTIRVRTAPAADAFTPAEREQITAAFAANGGHVAYVTSYSAAGFFYSDEEGSR